MWGMPNETQEGVGFYISYNSVDLEDYGDVTTALVYGQREAFYILNGDHRSNYAPRIAQGFESCFDYFKSCEKSWNHRSDHGEPEEVSRKFQAALDKLEKRLREN